MTPFMMVAVRVVALWLFAVVVGLLLWLGIALLLSVTLAHAQSATASEKAACHPDAVRLCGVTANDNNASLIRITQVAWCLYWRRDQLSKACRAAFAAHGMWADARPINHCALVLRAFSSRCVRRRCSAVSVIVTSGVACARQPSLRGRNMSGAISRISKRSQPKLALAWLAGIIVAGAWLIVLAGAASARDLDGSHATQDPVLHAWFDRLASGKGLCCSLADGLKVEDPDWDTQGDKDNSGYRVRLNGQWIEVPKAALVTEPNKFGAAVVWPYQDAAGVTQIRCFLPGGGA